MDLNEDAGVLQDRIDYLLAVENEVESLVSGIVDYGEREAKRMRLTREKLKLAWGEGQRCKRCRNYAPEVGENRYFVDLCRRCWEFVCSMPREEQWKLIEANEDLRKSHGFTKVDR